VQVTIAVDEIKAGGTACQPGDRVDIIASYQEPRTRRELTKMILQNVLVLWVDRGSRRRQPLMLVELPRP